MIRRFLQVVAGPDPSGNFSVLPDSTASAIDSACRTDWYDLITRLCSTGQLANASANSAEWPDFGGTFPGEDFNCPPIEQEILRLVGVAAAEHGEIQAPSITARLLGKIRTNPQDLPAAVVRVLKRPRPVLVSPLFHPLDRVATEGFARSRI